MSDEHEKFINKYAGHIIEGLKIHINNLKHRIDIVLAFERCMIGEIDKKLSYRIEANAQIYNNQITDNKRRIKELEERL